MLKSNKAPAENAVTTEMLKICTGKARSMIYRTVNKVWEQERMPNKWRIATKQVLESDVTGERRRRWLKTRGLEMLI